MTIPWWIWVTWALLAISSILGALAYRRLMRSLEDAVVLIFEAGWISSITGNNNDINFDHEKMNGHTLVLAKRILGFAKKIHRSWFDRTLSEYVVRWTIDGIGTRSVQ